MFNNYAIVQGVDQVVPVDVYAPGLPARARDADARHPHPARTDRDRRDPHAGATRPVRGAGVHDRAARRADRRRRPRCRPSRSGSGAEVADATQSPAETAEPEPTGRAAPSPSDSTARRCTDVTVSQVVLHASPRRPGRAGRRRCAARATALHRPHRGRLPRPRRTRGLPDGIERRALRGRGQPAVAPRTPAAAACGCRCPSRRPGRAQRCSTSTRAPRRWSARPSTCSASASTATPTCRAS